jgi:hypothetical protein
LDHAKQSTYRFFALLVFRFRWMRFQAAIGKFDRQLTIDPPVPHI